MESIGPGAVDACSVQLKARGVSENIAPSDAFEKVSNSGDMLHVRDLNKVLSTNHRYNSTDITPDSSAETIFDSNNVTVLAPETTEGPHCKRRRDLIRTNVAEKEPEPIPKAAIDFWHCNSTGVYGGVSDGGFMQNRNAGDTTLVNKTSFRGIPITTEDDVITFESKFPGHYVGRATHIHADVELLAPYNTNTMSLARNDQDFTLAQTAAGQYDPVMEYVYLGDTVNNGIFAWITVGVDTKYRKEGL
ncbi:aromatic compound dioxygenase [Eremomyces bilateralis CBS 781.70]|uniref:Aromatic compound dioxygenase n=1 Tax=Eremomyces bilateralis CBS 781.70 TaxID=1392243 RepID=A0A6G1FVL4_9PEZI|nr:aromatic compound dioxygenase [Eremomyces bilateralis CBS 781.70]KAF1809813.1 aromatic compound dioxygenase [Eremomyces bilateralis CBS 781.70]